jgi:hypothetical protein|tara:strand:- start:158 stop:265 length:108 start_codon:yes stop_codon:yes gene_type:complete
MEGDSSFKRTESTGLAKRFKTRYKETGEVKWQTIE